MQVDAFHISLVMPKHLFEKQLQNENMLRRNENIVEDGTSLGKSNRVERMEEKAVLLHPLM